MEHSNRLKIADLTSSPLSGAILPGNPKPPIVFTLIMVVLHEKNIEIVKPAFEKGKTPRLAQI